jgi:capsular exopolysaccharide synthesis family protein
MEELVRDTTKTPEEVESALALPLLGVVPAVKNIVINGNRRTEQTTTSFFAKRNRSKDKPQSGQWFRMDRDGKDNYQLAEAIRSLRTSIIFSIESHELKCLLFSSSIPDEGKTMISSNTSIALTQLGKRILMIDGDLRRPCLHKVFGTPNRRGLSEYLSEICEWEDVVQPSDVPGLDIITCGERPLNPAELLSSNRMSLIIHKAKSLYDLVILDSPTLLYMADSRILASYADSVVVIVRSRSTPTVLAKQACANVRGANTPILGVVLNRLEMGDSTYSYSDYSYPQPASQQ